MNRAHWSARNPITAPNRRNARGAVGQVAAAVFNEGASLARRNWRPSKWQPKQTACSSIVPGKVVYMRKSVFALAVCLLGLALASAPTSSQAQTQPSAQQEQSQPQAQQEQSQPQDQAQPSAPQKQSPTQPQGQQPSQPGTSTRGVPWVWIALGGAVFVIIVIALVARGGGVNRVERVERIEHHDDIRRAG